MWASRENVSFLFANNPPLFCSMTVSLDKKWQTQDGGGLFTR